MVVVIILVCCLALANGRQEHSHRIVMAKDYNLNERPASEVLWLLLVLLMFLFPFLLLLLLQVPDQPLLIRASVNLRNILDVAEKEQLVSLETTLRLFWKVGGW